MARLCANISFMFTEVPFLQRYKLAKNAGFKAVESGFPYGIPLEEVVHAKNEAGIDQILLNIYTGDVTRGELGFAAVPGREKEFSDSLNLTTEYAKALNVKKIHIMSGRVDSSADIEHDKCYLNNLKIAALHLQRENILGVIEPINNFTIPSYYLSSYEKAINFIEEVESPNLKLMVDFFHLQHIRGNITRALFEYKKYIGHIQIAQVPNRNEPDTLGELNYKYILDMLPQVGYDDWIGLEYKPANDTISGLKWITDYGYKF